MSRNFPDWLTAYCNYAGFSEAPRHMHFWTGVACVAGALRRKVWIDMAYFQWFPCFYIVLVAPPGIVSKSTTAAIGMNLLRKVPGINFGPDIVTWPALVTAFAAATESFEYNQEYYSQCAVILESSEFGNLVNPSDREMIDLLVSLWDAKTGGFKKITKGSGTDVVENPLINLIACTTPAWIAGNFPEYVIGGGFTSRCIFVYTEKKEKFVPYPSLAVPKGMKEVEAKLVQDLEHISLALCGPMKLSNEAIEWGNKWYAHHYNGGFHEGLADDDRFGGYLARKQTHIHKLAMILSVSSGDSQLITADDLALANKMVTDLEPDMAKVFAKIGRTEESIQSERFVKHIQSRGDLTVEEAHRFIHSAFPNANEFKQIFDGAIQAGLLEIYQSPKGFMVRAKNGVRT